jgi:hypothetical protein
MPDPTRAASTSWIYVNEYCRGIGFGRIPLQRENSGDQPQRTSPRHTGQFV